MIDFDHLVIAGPNLADLVTLVEEATGVRSVPGGPHVGLGTTNELIGVGPSTYIELIGPDPEQADHQGPRPFGINDLSKPTLVTWAVAVADIDLALAGVVAAGIDPGESLPMSRVRPDGVKLSWHLAVPPSLELAGIMPFSIDWGTDTPHPAASLSADLEIVDLTLRHENPKPIEAAIAAIAEGSILIGNGPANMSVTLRGLSGDLQL